MAPEASNVAAARRFVRERLTSAGLDGDLIETAVLLTSELVTNAVLHASSEFEVRVSIRPGVRVEIHDLSQDLPRRSVPAAESVGGRGLELVELLATDFGVTQLPDRGKNVWFVVDGAGQDSRGGWEDRTSRAHAGVFVHLLNLPLVLWEVMYEHNEALLREYVLYRVDRAGTQLDELDVGGVQRIRQQVATAVISWRASFAGSTLPSHADLTVELTDIDPAAGRSAAAIFAVAEELAAEGLLFTRPALPELAALRAWMFDQVGRQLAGQDAEPWTFTERQLSPPKVQVEVDPAWTSDPDQAIIVADDRGCILAVSAGVEALLGWPPAVLVGQRLTEIIPARLREAHIAGLTRQLITGRQRVLDTELELPALSRGGTETTMRVILSRELVDDQVVFLGRISPLTAPSEGPD